MPSKSAKGKGQDDPVLDAQPQEGDTAESEASPLEPSPPDAESTPDEEAELPKLALPDVVLARDSFGNVRTDNAGNILKTDGNPVTGLSDEQYEVLLKS